MWETILGGVLAIIGGWAAIWYQLRNTRKIRMDEVTAERKVTVNAEAYMYMKQIQSSHIQQDPKTTLDILANNEDWFFGNRLFLPGRFPEKWLLIRNDLSKSIRWRTELKKTTEEKIELEERIERGISDAIDEIYNDMNLERLDLRDALDKEE